MGGEYAPQFWAHLARTEQFYATMRNLKLKILWFLTAKHKYSVLHAFYLNKIK